jgi:hypothetical protein
MPVRENVSYCKELLKEFQAELMRPPFLLCIKHTQDIRRYPV